MSMSKALSSIPCSTTSHKKHDEWVGLIEDLGAREMESGLVQLIFALLKRMHARHRRQPRQLIDYVVNNAAAWTFPEIAGEKPTSGSARLNEWERHMATLDTAILSLIGEADVPDDRIEVALDTILQSSLWQRRLLRSDDASRLRYRVTLASREAGYIWASRPPRRDADISWPASASKPGTPSTPSRPRPTCSSSKRMQRSRRRP